MRLHHLALALASLVSVSAAQKVTFLGQVEDVQGTANQFFVDCTDTQLTSAAFNLNAFVGQSVRITGSWNGSANAPSVDVTSIDVVPERFEVGGNGKLGEKISVGVFGAPGDLALFFASPAPGFVNFGSEGVAFLDLFASTLVAQGQIPGGGNLEFQFPVPNNPALEGLSVYAQAVVFDQQGGFLLTNSDCETFEQ